MKLVFGIFIMLFTVNSFSQDLINLPFNLKLDSSRDIVAVNKSMIYMDGEVVSEATQTSSYTLKVIDTTFRTTFSYKKELADNFKNIDSEEIPKDELIESFVYLVEENLKCLEYHIIVDNSSREPIEFLNDSIYDKNIGNTTEDLLAKFPNLIEDEEEKDRFSEKTKEYLKMSRKNILESIRLDFANILSPYTYQFPNEGEVENEVVIDDIAMFSEVPDNEIDATITISSELNGNNIAVLSELNYDKEKFLAVAKKANAAFNDVKKDELQIIERNSFEANLPSNWLEKYDSERIISIPGIKVINISNMKFY